MAHNADAVRERKFVLDSSAVFTLIEEEEGADRVQEVIAGGGAILPFLVFLEVYYVTLQERGRDEAGRRYALLKELPAEQIWEMDERTLLTAGRFKAEHGLSLADAQIAGFAVRRGATLLHKDPEYRLLADEVPQELLPLKGGYGEPPLPDHRDEEPLQTDSEDQPGRR